MLHHTVKQQPPPQTAMTSSGILNLTSLPKPTPYSCDHANCITEAQTGLNIPSLLSLENRSSII